MKIVGIFAFFFGYTLIYAGVSRIQGKKNNTIMGLLGFKQGGPAGSLIQSAIDAAQAKVPAPSGGGDSGGGSPTPDGSGTITPIPNSSGTPNIQGIPNYSGNPISGPPITGTI